MGCDIHMFVEKKSNGNWIDADLYEKKEDGSFSLVELMRDRNYTLFATIANVRNRAGIDYISESKGLPSDVRADVYDEYKSMEDDAHHPSYLTLSELYIWINGREYSENHQISTVRKLISKLNDRKESVLFFGCDEDIRIVFWFDN